MYQKTTIAVHQHLPTNHRETSESYYVLRDTYDVSVRTTSRSTETRSALYLGLGAVVFGGQPAVSLGVSEVLATKRHAFVERNLGDLLFGQ